MKNLIIKILKKEITHRIGVSLITFFFFFLNYINKINDLPFIICLLLLLVLGTFLIIFLKSKRLAFLGRYFIILGASMMLLSIMANNMPENFKDNSEYSKSCDDLIYEMCKGDSAVWNLYKKRDPETVSHFAYILLENSICYEDVSFKHPYLKYADSLLNELKKTDIGYAYYGRAYKEYIGLGCEKSINEAVRDAVTSLSLKNFSYPYLLLEKMNLDSAEYPEVVSRVRIWRDSVNNATKLKHKIISSTLIPNLSEKTIRLNLSFYTSDTGNSYSSVLKSASKNNLDDSLIKRTYLQYDSVYLGDSSSFVWNIIDNNLEVFKNYENLQSILAAYYWGKGKQDSAQLYFDKSGFFYNTWNQYHNFHSLYFTKSNFDKDVAKHLDDVLHYTSLNDLNQYKTYTKDPLIYHVLDASYQRRFHHLIVSAKQNNSSRWKEVEDSLTFKTYMFIKQLRPNIK